MMNDEWWQQHIQQLLVGVLNIINYMNDDMVKISVEVRTLVCYVYLGMLCLFLYNESYILGYCLYQGMIDN